MDPTEGPIARFAYELRKLRQDQPQLTYRVMAARVHYSAAALAQAAAGHRMPTLPVALAYVRACGGDVQHWEERWRQAAREHTDRLAEHEDVHTAYRGLAAFGEADHHLFFGRDALADRLAALLEERSVVLVVGPSGSGKSSLLRAGLLPRLRGAAVVVTPGTRPDGPLATTPGGVIVVDQFEEVFTLWDEAPVRAAFIGELLEAAEGGVRVVLAVRADFLGHCAAYRALVAATQQATLLVGAMDRDELRAAIVRPAAAAGLIVERELTARILNEVDGEPGGLPLMSHALLETWRRRYGRALTLAAYESAGGIHGAIARTSEQVYGSLIPAQQTRLRHLLLRLVTPGQNAPDSRRPTQRSELLLADDDETLLERLAQARLVTVEQDRVEVAHEALLTAWPRLRAWIDDDREWLRAQRQFTEAAATWHELAREAGALYRGARLSMVRERCSVPEAQPVLTPLEREFLTASIQSGVRSARRRVRRRTGMAALLVVGLTAGLLAWQEDRAGRQRQRETDAWQAVGVAESLRESDPQLAMRLALAAWKVSDLPETRSGLLAAAYQRQQDVFIDPDTEPGTMRSLSADGRTLLSLNAGRFISWDVDTHQAFHIPGDPALFPKLGMRTEQGRHLPVLDERQGVTLWDLSTGRHDARELASATDGVEMGASGKTVLGYSAIGARYRIQLWEVNQRRLLWQIWMPRDAEAGVRELSVIRHEPAASAVRDVVNGRYRTDRLIPDATISPDDRLVALCVPGRRLQLWDVTTGRRLDATWAPLLSTWECSSERVRFTPDGRRLAVLAPGRVRLWDIGSGTELSFIPHAGVGEIAFSDDSALAVTADRQDIKLWRTAAPSSEIMRHPLNGEQVQDLRIDLRENWIRYRGGSESWPSTVRTLGLGRITKGEWHDNLDAIAAFAQGAKVLVRVSHAPAMRDIFHAEVRHPSRSDAPLTLPASTCRRTRGVPGFCRPLLALRSDGEKAAYGTLFYKTSRADQKAARSPVELSVWDRNRSGLDTFEVTEDAETVGGIGFGADRTTLLIMGMQDRVLRLWDLDGRRAVSTVEGFHGVELAVRPGGSLAVSSSGDVLDLRVKAKPSDARSPGMSVSLAFSPDGRRFAAGNDSGRIDLWDGTLSHHLGDLRPEVAANPGSVLAVAFAPDSRLLASGNETSLQLWDVISRRPVGPPLPTAGDRVRALAFSSDGTVLYTSGVNVPLQKYDISPTASAAAICRRVSSGLSPQEWDHLPPPSPLPPDLLTSGISDFGRLLQPPRRAATGDLGVGS
ncbi:hypothetical protein ACIBEJ_33530 [Nonomuraea sp. NPDC050790]|uniref:WD40 repeat domain-containing protein n=1 Tax=Nonomuraea sp. NPDC050790 TaxID=3364371 RepID=UPI0037BD8608